jgi:aryl-alcohol dehydrogenase-like predicted oxidoreductase
MSRTFLLAGEWEIHRMGYGAMRLCGQPGNFGPYPDWEAGKALLRRAVELGVRFFDTAHPYGPGFNEELLADALAPYADGIVVATKGGVEKTAPDRVFPDGRPESLRRFCEASLRRLRMDCLPLYQLHRPDPAVPFLESVDALAALREEGKIRHVGLSNVSLDQVIAAGDRVPIVSVQNRYNLTERADDPVVDYCAARGVAYVPWAPLAAQPFAPGAPLAREDGPLERIARGRGLTPGQVALAWLLARSPNILLIPGTTSLVHLEENAVAASVALSAPELLELDALGKA